MIPEKSLFICAGTCEFFINAPSREKPAGPIDRPPGNPYNKNIPKKGRDTMGIEETIKKAMENEKVQEVVKEAVEKAKEIDPKDLKEGLDKVRSIIPDGK